MKGYEEFKSYRTRLSYDPKTKTFTTRNLVNAEFVDSPRKKKAAAGKRKAPRHRP